MTLILQAASSQQLQHFNTVLLAPGHLIQQPFEGWPEMGRPLTAT
jgi:hypothetical protein